MAGKYIDAAAALAELDRAPVVLKNFQGQDWALYSAMPAKPVFKLMHLQASGRAQDEMSGGELLTMAAEMVPPAVLDAWLEGGMTTAEIVVLMGAIIAAYNGEDDASEEGEAVGPKTVPKKGPTRSSKTGSR